MLAPHGTTVLAWHHDILDIRVHGPFNLEGANINFKKIQDAVVSRPHEQWARIDILDDETLGAPDVLGVVSASYMWCFASGCSCIACVCKTNIQRQMIRTFSRKTQLNIHAFSDYSEAHQWCNEQMGRSRTSEAS